MATQEAREKERLSKGPVLRFHMGVHGTFLPEDKWQRGLIVRYENPLTMYLNVENVGSAPLLRPELVVTAIPTTVRLDNAQSDDMPKRQNLYRIFWHPQGMQQITSQVG